MTANDGLNDGRCRPAGGSRHSSIKAAAAPPAALAPGRPQPRPVTCQATRHPYCPSPPSQVRRDVGLRAEPGADPNVHLPVQNSRGVCGTTQRDVAGFDFRRGNVRLRARAPGPWQELGRPVFQDLPRAVLVRPALPCPALPCHAQGRSRRPAAPHRPVALFDRPQARYADRQCIGAAPRPPRRCAEGAGQGAPLAPSNLLPLRRPLPASVPTEPAAAEPTPEPRPARPSPHPRPPPHLRPSPLARRSTPMSAKACARSCAGFGGRS